MLKSSGSFASLVFRTRRPSDRQYLSSLNCHALPGNRWFIFYMDTTIIIFRKDRTGWRDCFALFPELPSDEFGRYRTC